MNNNNRSQTVKVQTLVRAMENLEPLLLSPPPQMPVLYPMMQEVNTPLQQPPSPALIAYGIRLEVWLVLVLHFLVLWSCNRR